MAWTSTFSFEGTEHTLTRCYATINFYVYNLNNPGPLTVKFDFPPLRPGTDGQTNGFFLGRRIVWFVCVDSKDTTTPFFFFNLHLSSMA